MRKLKAAWIIILFCGVFGTLNGVISYGSALFSIFDPGRAWVTGAGFTTITLEQLSAWSPEAAPYWVLVNIVAWVNVTATGITLACAAWFGVRRRQRWGWWVAFAIWLWVGINDSVGVLAVYRMTGKFIPTAPIPVAVGAIGLALAYGAVFGARRDPPAGAAARIVEK